MRNLLIEWDNGDVWSEETSEKRAKEMTEWAKSGECETMRRMFVWRKGIQE